jgi:hypothetical protein
MNAYVYGCPKCGRNNYYKGKGYKTFKSTTLVIVLLIASGIIFNSGCQFLQDDIFVNIPEEVTIKQPNGKYTCYMFGSVAYVNFGSDTVIMWDKWEGQRRYAYSFEDDNICLTNKATGKSINKSYYYNAEYDYVEIAGVEYTK